CTTKRWPSLAATSPVGSGVLSNLRLRLYSSRATGRKLPNPPRLLPARGTGALLCYIASFVILPDEKPTMLTVRIRSMVLTSLLLICTQAIVAQQAKTRAAPPTAFTPEVAVKLMDQLLQGLQTHNQAQFLSVFDPEFMTNYSQFADQISVLFTQYESFVGRYHV